MKTEARVARWAAGHARELLGIGMAAMLGFVAACLAVAYGWIDISVYLGCTGMSLGVYAIVMVLGSLGDACPLQPRLVVRKARPLLTRRARKRYARI